jgi:GTPase SAR1 family protein
MDSITGISFFHDGGLLISKSHDGTIFLWRTDTEEIVAVFKEQSSSEIIWPIGLTFHPNAPILAALSKRDTIIRIWNLNLDTILNTYSPSISSVSYTNAKVVLVGDSGVGKSGLGLVLIGKNFELTESTHNRRVWTLENREDELGYGRKEVREILLWDLAGQPGYRLIHQLHLNEVAVALVVFDARNETDPFAGVLYWDRALHQSQHFQGDSAIPLKKFLVQARIDRGGIGVGPQQIQSLVQRLGFDGYFETSAKEGWYITDLREAILKSVNWDLLPKVSSTGLFREIKTFLVAEKNAGRFLSTEDDLYYTFLVSKGISAEKQNLRTQFETCIGRVESAGLIKRLSFGRLILLQPELLDAYASALVNTVREEPDGLGHISEDLVRAGLFRVPEDERIKDKEQEKLLMIAMIEDLLHREIVLREEPFLVFPTQSTRENLDFTSTEGKAVVFDFEGPIQNIYATLAVRIAHSGMFKKKDMWKNAITYTSSVGGTCGIILNNLGEGHCELALFFDQFASEETRYHFEEYIRAHLQRRILLGSFKRRRIFTCSACGWVVTDQTVRLLAMRGSNMLDCPICKEHIILLDREKRFAVPPSSQVLQMNRAADKQRERDASKLALQGKKATRDFDVFLCYHGVDKLEVKKIGEQLKELGILPWLDEWELRPGIPWQRLLEEQIKQIKSIAVFVGKEGRGPWQDMEIYAFLRQFIKRECPVIPVILSDCNEIPDLPIFLESMTWVDFRQVDPEPMKRLIWGIVGEREAAYSSF